MISPGIDRVEKTTYPPSSFCNLASGLPLVPPVIGVGVEAGAAPAPPPPPPLKGFAMRPKLSGEDAAVFCAM